MIKENSMQVPKLRFKEFKLPYSKYQLSNYLIESKLKNKNLIYNKNDVLSVSGKFGVINQIELQGRSFAGEKVNNYHIVETNDIVYTKSPLKLSPYGIIKVNNGISGIVSTLYAVYHVLPNAIPKYIDFYFDYNLRLNKYLKPIVNIGAKHDMKISNEYVLTNYVSFPSIEEQTKIANFLSLIDRKIEIQEKLVENLKLYKRGLLQKVFSNNLGWKSAKLGDFLIPNDKISVEDTSKYKKLTVKLNLQGLEENIVKRTMLDTRPFYIRHQGEIIIGKQNYFNGSIAIISKKFDNYICSNAIMSFSISNANIYFIYYQISQSDYINKRSYMANGTGQKELSEKDFLNFDIKIPNIEEQNQIANLFSNLDRKIDFETKKLQDLKTYKKGLLQQMFI